jgi:hypothetical protein
MIIRRKGGGRGRGGSRPSSGPVAGASAPRPNVPTEVFPRPAPPILVAVSPATATVEAGGTQQFVAEIRHARDESVVWSVEGDGAIDAAGLYIAPGAAGSATVRATSAADSAVTGQAAVTVAASGPAILFADNFEDQTYAKWSTVTPAEALPATAAALAGTYGARIGSAATQLLNATSIITARPVGGALRLAWDWRVPAAGLAGNETLLVQFLNDWDALASLTVIDGVPTVRTLAKDGATYADTPLDLTLPELWDAAIHAWAIDYDDSATPTVTTVRRDGVALATVEDASAYGAGVEQFWWTAGISLSSPTTPGTYHDVDTVTLYDGIPGA